MNRDEIIEYMLSNDRKTHKGNKYSVSCLYSWSDIKKEMDIKKEFRSRPKPVRWTICEECEIENEFGEKVKLSIPIEYFDLDDLDMAVDKFLMMEANLCQP